MFSRVTREVTETPYPNPLARRGAGRRTCPFSYDRWRSAVAIYTLESLVLRGVSVLCDGKAVELCRGASEANMQTPEVRISMRHPSQGYPQANPNALADQPDHDAKRDVAAAAFGTGRSRGLAGVLSRRSPACSAGS